MKNYSIKNIYSRFFVLLFSPLYFGNAYAVQYSVTDYSGRTVKLNVAAERIVALAPHIVENIFSAGAGDLLVGVSEYSNYPEQAKEIERVGLRESFSIEAIVSLQPDLVIAWSSGSASNKYRKLQDLGIAVYFDEPKKLTDVAKSINDIGVLTGRYKIAQKAANKYLSDLNKLQKAYTSRKTVAVLYQVWNSPLQTINKDSIISDVIHLCGGRNIFADAAMIAPKISIESVLHRNPEAIVASGMGEERPDWLNQWLAWPTISAVKQKNLFFIHPDLLQRHTIRLLQGGQQLCEQLELVRNKN